MLRISKRLAFKGTRIGTRLYCKGGYYVVTGSEPGEEDIWICELADRQGNAPNRP